jgi:hypothetical protein
LSVLVTIILMTPRAVIAKNSANRAAASTHIMKIFDNPASNLRGECNSDFGFL